MLQLDGPRWGPHAGGPAKQLVVVCHGVGSDGHDLMPIAEMIGATALPHAAFVCPHGPEPYDQDPGGPGRQWFSLADRAPKVMEAGVRRAAASLGSFIDAELARLALPPDAFALIGFSQGAMTVLFTGLRRTPPRGIIAYAGALLGVDTLAAELTGRPPVLLVHGDADPVVPAQRSRDAATVLAAIGVPCQTLFCPGLGHTIDQAGLDAGIAFLGDAFP